MLIPLTLNLQGGSTNAYIEIELPGTGNLVSILKGTGKLVASPSGTSSIRRRVLKDIGSNRWMLALDTNPILRKPSTYLQVGNLNLVSYDYTGRVKVVIPI